MSDTKPPEDLRDEIEGYIHSARLDHHNVLGSVDAILRLCEAAALAALPEKDYAIAWTTDGSDGKYETEFQKGRNLAIATAQANIHSVFGGKAA